MTLARFTPSILDGETLERLFVQRHHLLDDVMTAVRDAASGDERRHKLFVGPRGAGKTHLVSLVNHRVRRAMADGLHVGLSWLMEDPWDIETYDDLLDQILENFSGEASGGVGEQALRDLVAANGPIVVLVENLDQILTAIGADGQRQLRALLENGRPLLLIATSTRLSEDLLSQAEPFYGFFDDIQLEPFSVEQAADMLWHVAQYADDQPLTALLQSSHATARLATIAHLAGGQPRVWALLGTGLTDTGIDDMVDMLLARFDDLTPYYQEQLARLSPSERKAVRRLADVDRPLTIRDLAELAKTDQRSMSKTVSDLRKRGWVRKHESILTAKVDARLSYYELAEPLARIAFQMKAARGKPVRLVVEFLSTWFEASQLEKIAVESYRSAAVSGQSDRLLIAQGLAAERPRKVGGVELISELRLLDDALADYERTGNAAHLMEFSGAISKLLEERLRTMSVADVRILVARLALACGVGEDWRHRLEQIADSFDDVRRVLVLAMVAIADGESSEIIVDTVDQLGGRATEDERNLLGGWIAQMAGITSGKQAAHAVVSLSAMRCLKDVTPRVALDLSYYSAIALWRGGDSEGARRTMVEARQSARHIESDKWLLFLADFQSAGIYYLLGEHEHAMRMYGDLISDGSTEHSFDSPALNLIVRYCLARSLAMFDVDAALVELEAIQSNPHTSSGTRMDAKRLANSLRATAV